MHIPNSFIIIVLSSLLHHRRHRRQYWQLSSLNTKKKIKMLQFTFINTISSVLLVTSKVLNLEFSSLLIFVVFLPFMLNTTYYYWTALK